MCVSHFLHLHKVNLDSLSFFFNIGGVLTKQYMSQLPGFRLEGGINIRLYSSVY